MLKAAGSNLEAGVPPENIRNTSRVPDNSYSGDTPSLRVRQDETLTRTAATCRSGGGGSVMQRCIFSIPHPASCLQLWRVDKLSGSTPLLLLLAAAPAPTLPPLCPLGALA